MWMDAWVLNVPAALWPRCEAWPYRVRFFETQRNVVVLSSSNDPEREVQERRCERLGVPILRRRGGGGTVVLGPGCVVLTAAFFVRELYVNDRYFRFINELWIEALASMGVAGLGQRGISDIVLGDRKVAGTSIFRKKNLLVYQGSLLVNPDLALIEHLLRHPSREPDYRQGRDHRSFVTSLRDSGFALGATQVAAGCEEWFGRNGISRLAAFLKEDDAPRLPPDSV